MSLRTRTRLFLALAVPVDLDDVIDVLRDHADDPAELNAEDPKGKHLQPYLSSLSVHVGERQKEMIREVHSLATSKERAE